VYIRDVASMFASVALAARIDRAEKRLTESVVRAVMADDSTSERSERGALTETRAFVEAIGGGVAAYAGPSSPMSKMIGVGFEGLPDERRLVEIEELFGEREAPLQAEVATLADPAFVAELTRRGYVLTNFENVSGRPIVDGDRSPPGDLGVRIDLMTEANAADWIDTAITAFQHPDGRGVPADELPPREALDAALRPWTRVDGFLRYCAWVDEQLAGVATMRIDDGVAQLCGAATLPAFRRRGIQGMLLRRRLADGARAGCDLAVVTTQPGSTSQENVNRQGFTLLYPRAVLIKEPSARLP
jgi:ribosomal protein S18 acetylase RimI-like enzyme